LAAALPAIGRRPGACAADRLEAGVAHFSRF
jgi:hypothetical protein